MAKRFKSFAQFYPFYLSQHQNLTCRVLHYAGSLLIIVVAIFILLTQQWLMLWWLPVIGYSFAWVGHFIFEKNKPATFQYPVYSLMADWVMLFRAIFRKNYRE
ncbi:Mpo1-like protein [Shewanella youngdeokensis]|uniref:Mpo1-like protein n=1 Tax=Shewanella youngdeokensis TaxID=2999068 RepID=A0ABZ0JVI2_9GAMM|nr:Mpo1-like protein [Shewanella sp. DAU334]